MTVGRHRRPASGRTKGAVTVTAALIAGLLAGTATWSAWNAQTDNDGNSFAAGTIALGDNSAGVAMFNLAGLSPGTTYERCIRVDYTGSLAAGVKMFGAATAGDGLEDYLDLTVTRGDDPSATYSGCGTFVPDAADHLGLGAGVLFQNAISAYPTTAAAGIADPQATWANGDSHFYKFSVEMQANNLAQGKTVTQSFSWLAE